MRAQGVTLEPLEGELAVDFDGYWARFPSLASDGLGTWREWVLLRVQGSVSDPRLVRFDLAFRPMLGQRNWSGISESPSGDIVSLNGLTRIDLFAGAPVGLNALWTRVSDNQTMRFGAEQETDATVWELGLVSRWRPLPARLTYTDRSLLQLFRPNPGVANLLNEHRRVLRLSASNRKLRIDLERLAYENRTTQIDFAQTLADIDHSFRWGKGSRLTSGILYLNRSGASVVERLGWRQSARLQHTRTFSSSLGYNLFDMTSLSDFSRGWSASYLGSWNRRNHVNLSVGGDTRHRSFRLGTQSYSRLRSRAILNTPLPYDFSLQAGAGLGYEWHSQTLAEDDGFGTAIDERHVVDETGSFVLDEPLAEPGSVVIKSEDAATVFEEGLDYRLVVSGVSLEVFALPGGRLTEGTIVLVDYRFQLLPEGDANSWIYSYDLTLRQGPFTAFYRRAVQNRVKDGYPEAGNVVISPTLRDYDDVATGLRVSGRVPLGTASAAVEHERRSTLGLLRSKQTQIRFGWRFPVGHRLKAGLTSRFTSRTNGSRFQIFEGTSRADWYITPKLKLQGELSAYDWLERGFGRDRFFGGGVGLEWHYRQLNVIVRFDRNAWTRGFERTENRLVARVIRSF